MTARRAVGVFVFAVLLVAFTSTWAQMPDVRQMSGIPMAVDDVPNGTVVVRVVRATIADNVVGQMVELQVAGKPQTVKTDAEGHARFDGLAAGTSARASATIDGRRVESQFFQMPASGGIRIILAAGAESGAASATSGQISAVAGEVILGGDSRIQIEFDDDSLTLFYVFDIVNAGGSPVSPKSELVLDLPEGAVQPTLLEGSSTQATLRGSRLTIVGPFAPGSTPVQVAFGLPPGGSERTITQALPLAWGRVQVMATKLPGVSMTSAEFTTASEVPGDAHAFVIGTGAGLPAGKVLSVTLTGVPSRNHIGRYFALALGVLILIGGAWAVATAPARTGDLGRKVELEQRRGKLMADLVKLETQQRTGSADISRYASRRSDLLAQLERVYGELDQRAGAPGEGLVV